MKFPDTLSAITYALSLVYTILPENYGEISCNSIMSSYCKKVDYSGNSSPSKDTNISLYSSNSISMIQSANTQFQTKVYLPLLFFSKVTICFFSYDYFLFCNQEKASSNNIGSERVKTNLTKISTKYFEQELVLEDDIKTKYSTNLLSQKNSDVCYPDFPLIAEEVLQNFEENIIGNLHNDSDVKDLVVFKSDTIGQQNNTNKDKNLIQGYKRSLIKVLIIILTSVLIKRISLLPQSVDFNWNKSTSKVKSIYDFYQETILNTKIFSGVKNGEKHYYYNISESKIKETLQQENNFNKSKPVLLTKTRHIDNQNIKESEEKTPQINQECLKKNSDCHSNRSVCCDHKKLNRYDDSIEKIQENGRKNSLNESKFFEDHIDKNSDNSSGYGDSEISCISDEAIILITTEEEFKKDKKVNDELLSLPSSIKLTVKEKDSLQKKFMETYNEKVLEGQRRKEIMNNVQNDKNNQILHTNKKEYLFSKKRSSSFLALPDIPINFKEFKKLKKTSNCAIKNGVSTFKSESLIAISDDISHENDKISRKPSNLSLGDLYGSHWKTVQERQNRTKCWSHWQSTLNNFAPTKIQESDRYLAESKHLQFLYQWQNISSSVKSHSSHSNKLLFKESNSLNKMKDSVKAKRQKRLNTMNSPRPLQFEISDIENVKPLSQKYQN